MQTHSTPRRITSLRRPRSLCAWACMALACGLSILGSALPAQQAASPYPAVVYILRHAEKPAFEKDPHLAPQGEERAHRLPLLFLGGPGGVPAPRLDRPTALFASDASKHSNRPMETLAPLGQRLNMRINHDYLDFETGPLARRILSGQYAGQVVVICWHHAEIPQLARDLGVTDAPHKWDGDVFDRIWEIRWVEGRPQWRQIQQGLLPGDSAP